MSIAIYLRYKAHVLREKLKHSDRTVSRTKFWWKIYTVVLISSLVMTLLSDTQESRDFFMLFAVISIVLMLVLTVFKDYKSGAHTHWWRKGRLETKEGTNV
jgi:uncharacterized membrane protein YhaH (DUF805 family)